MEMQDILSAMAANRAAHDGSVAAIRRNAACSDTQRQAMLADAWCRAMRTHYGLLSRYLELRQRRFVELNRSHAAIEPRALHAPALPAELPRSLSRYVFAGVEPERVLASETPREAEERARPLAGTSL